jgi:hypothetical protein
VATAGRDARMQAIQEGAIPPLLELCVFGDDAACDQASAAMWQLTCTRDSETVGNPLAYERGGCRVPADSSREGTAWQNPKP